MIHIFESDCRGKVPGHKEQTDKSDIVLYQPKVVYVPATDNKGAQLIKALPAGEKVKIGSLLGIRPDFNLPVYSPVSGTIKAIVKKKNSILGRPADFFEIENDGSDDQVFMKPLVANPNAEEVVEKIRESGLVGLGGAGFPTYIKYKTDAKIDTLIVNAAECEPYLTTDFVMGTRTELSEFFKTINVLLQAFHIKNCIIGVKADKEELITSLTNGIKASENEHITLKKLKPRYPAGYERNLVYECTKRKYDVLPCEVGVIVNNIQTLIELGHFFFQGAVVSKRLITVSGMVNNPSNILTPFGLTADDALNAAGGSKLEEGVVINGGPMCGEAISKGDVPLLVTCGGITVLPLKKFREEPCLRCGECTANCPCNLQPCEINYAAKHDDYDRVYDLDVLRCVQCGLCSYVCPSHIDVAAGVKQAKSLVVFKCARARKK